MAKKKTKRSTSKDASWDQIGKMVGNKIETECKKDKSWKWQCKSSDCGGFLGRLLFIIGLLMSLNATGHLTDVSGWAIFLIGAGFAMMKF